MINHETHELHKSSERTGNSLRNPTLVGSHFEPQNRSRRREEADAIDLAKSPPPYVGGYEREVYGKGVSPSFSWVTELRQRRLTSSPTTEQ